jgi:hypothetical protein
MTPIGLAQRSQPQACERPRIRPAAVAHDQAVAGGAAAAEALAAQQLAVAHARCRKEYVVSRHQIFLADKRDWEGKKSEEKRVSSCEGHGKAERGGHGVGKGQGLGG